MGGSVWKHLEREEQRQGYPERPLLLQKQASPTEASVLRGAERERRGREWQRTGQSEGEIKKEK